MSIHSIDGTAGLTKLERIGLRAKHDIDTVFNNVGHILDIKLLREQYHKLDGRKAIGIDGVSKIDYGNNLEENLGKVIQKIRNGIYQPKPSRLVEIAKEDGSKRPLAISCTEDKIIQSAIHKILSEIYEPIFLPCSYGFRPNRNGAIVEDVVKQVIRVVKRWINYHAISDNNRRVKAFTLASKRIMFKWLQHRGGRRHMNWDQYTRMLQFAGYPERWKLISMF